MNHIVQSVAFGHWKAIIIQFGGGVDDHKMGTGALIVFIRRVDGELIPQRMVVTVCIAV